MLISLAIFFLFLVCGVLGRVKRIAGGVETYPHEYPWMVALYLDQHRCGGAIISNRHIMTAAHCVDDVDPTTLRVLLGGHNIITDYTEIRLVKEVHQHENYDSATYDNDIAILELDRAIEFGPEIQPICLPETHFEDYTNKLTLVAGWGRMGENEKSAKKLRSVNVPVLSQEECNEIESKYRDWTVSDNMICAGYPEGIKDSCPVSKKCPFNRQRLETITMNAITSNLG